MTHPLRNALLAVCIAVTFATASFAASPPPATEVLDHPEGAFWHEASQSWFVSNWVGGRRLADGGDGFLTRFDASGTITAARWASGLDTPTGITGDAESLFVVTAGAVLQIDVASAAVQHRWELPGSTFANDIARAPDGTLYVSDMFENRIYRIEGEAPAEVWLDTPQLESPNGLWVEGDRLWAVTWGPITDRSTFASSRSGTLLSIDRKSGTITPAAEGRAIANFDGVVTLDGICYATDWRGGRLLRFDAAGRETVVLSGLFMLADLGVDSQRRVLGLPVMADNRFLLLRLPE